LTETNRHFNFYVLNEFFCAHLKKYFQIWSWKFTTKNTTHNRYRDFSL